MICVAQDAAQPKGKDVKGHVLSATTDETKRSKQTLRLGVKLQMAALTLPALPSLSRFTTFLGACTPYPTSFKIRVHVSPSVPLCLATRKLSILSSMSQPSSEPAGPENNDDVLLQYVVLRRDLIDTWPLGSVVTQGCHASIAAIWSHKDDPYTLQYCSPQNIDSMHKVTLEVKGETQILNLSEKLTAGGIAYKLWIEQPENIPTCLATKPYPKSLVSMFFKKLKLCK